MSPEVHLSLQFGPTPVSAFAITNDSRGLAILLTLNRVPEGDLKLYASPPCNAGHRRNWDWRVLETTVEER